MNTEQTQETNQNVNRSKRGIWIGAGVVIILLLAGAIFMVQRGEQQQLDAGRQAVTSGEWDNAITSLTAALETRPAFLRRAHQEAAALRGVAHYYEGTWEAALVDFDAALTGENALFDIYAYRADVHYRLGSHDLALADAEKALASNNLPAHLVALLQADRALILAEEGEMETAVTAINAAFAYETHLSDAQLVALYTLQASAAVEAGDDEAALTHLHAALAVDTAISTAEEAALRTQVTQSLYRQEMWQDALAAVDRALTLRDGLDEESVAALYVMQAELLLAQGELETAVAAAEQAANYDDTLALPYALNALAAYQAFEYDAALTAVEEAIALDADNSLAHRVRGAVYTWQGKINDAIAELDQALATEPDDIEALALRAYNYLALDKDEEAAADIEAMLSINPDAPAVLWAQARYEYSLFNDSLAQVLIDQAIALDNSRPEFFLQRSLLHNLPSEWEKVQADADDALALNPDFAPAILSHVRARVLRYEFEGVEEDLERIITLTPDWYAGYDFLATYLKNVELDQEAALDTATQAIEKQPDIEDGYVTRGYIHLFSGDLALARADFEHALTIAPDAHAPHLAMSRLLGEEGNLEEAEGYLLEYAAITDNSHHAKTAIAFLHLIDPDSTQSWELAHEVLAEDPLDVDAIYLRVVLLADAGKVSQALGELEEALVHYPNEANLNGLAARMSLSVGELEAARTYAETALAGYPKLTDAVHVLFTVAVQEGDFDEAQRQLDKWLELTPEDEINYNTLVAMYLAIGNIDSAFETYARGLEVEDDLHEISWLHYGRAYAYLNQGDVDAYRADFAKVLETSTSLDLIADAEYQLVQADSAPVLVNGRYELTDNETGYRISYADYWVQQVLDDESNLTLLLRTENAGGEASFNAIIIPTIEGVTIDDIATFLSEQVYEFEKGRSYGISSRSVGGTNGRLVDYEIQITDVNGNPLMLRGHQYIAFDHGYIFIFTAESSAESFDSYIEEFVLMIDSIEFLP